MAEMQCPRCQSKVSDLQTIDPGLADRIRLAGNSESLPAQVCVACFAELSGSIAQGSVVQMQEKAQEQKKLMLWKSRVNLIKKARQLMLAKAFSEAAVQYEKYIKVLELVFGCAHGALKPEHFKDSARTQELTVVAGVYWDLMRIYDTSEKYGERMIAVSKKLAEFLRYTPVFPDIIRKAEAFQKTAKNPSVVKSFIKNASDAKGRCFIATAAFSSAQAPEVFILQDWRDGYLLKRPWGQVFVQIYYRISPPMAAVLDRLPILKAPVRAILRWWIRRLQ